MRTQPINPAELRDWLIKKAEAWREAAKSLDDPHLQLAQHLGIDTLEVVRHEFLDDLSFYDDPTEEVLKRSHT